MEGRRRRNAGNESIVRERLQLYWQDGIFKRCREEINRENRMAIHLLAVVGLPLSAINLFVQMVVVGGSMPLARGCWLMLYFAVLLLLERRVIPENYPHSTALLYLLEVPMMLICALLGTLWDPNHQATTFMMFMMTLPAFVLDRPDRSLGILAAWSALFLILCMRVKAPELLHIDMVHLLEYYMTASAVTIVILRVRLRSLRHLEKAQYHLEHERETDCLTRYALASRVNEYLDRPLALLLGDLDQLKLYSDFYGHEAGDAMNRYFIRTMMEVFGADHTYRYGGDELLCVLVGGTMEDCQKRIEKCRERLHAFERDGRSISLSCAFGCVTGTPHSAVEFREMIQLTDIYTHKAKQSGMDQTLGGPFDQEHLREGIVESNMFTHAHAYEINHLTGLPGMSYFVARSDELLSSIADVPRQPVVGCFKLQHMRDFNDEFGYAQGDRLIADTAKLLKQHFSGRHLCHITSGQFGILCYRDEAEGAIRQVEAALKTYKPGFPVMCKVGFSTYTGTETAISLMDRARIAQKSIVNRPDAVICFYDDRLDEETHFRQYIVNHVDDALEKGYLKVYYQPIARAVTGEVCNEEALSRWDDPRYGFLMPYRFIPPLEESGLMYKVNLHVVRQVLRDFKTRQEKGVPIVPISVNLSRRDFELCDMVQAITRLVDESGFPRSLIKIEITESAFISNQELLKREVGRFRESGFEVWLDDFGSEYSTLNLLQELDFDLIKIDMQFMKNFSVTGKNFIIISDIIDMAKRMGVTTLIEGIETREHYEVMQRLGCEKIQGFLFNRPNPLDYIINRALTGTGLRFERPEATPYYEAVGRVDLSAPMVQGSGDQGPHMSGEMPAGILEERENRFTCLRGNEAFLRLLESWGALAEAVQGERYRPLVTPAPERFLNAAQCCKQAKGWHSFTESDLPGGALSVYMRRLCAHTYNGGTALLVVLVHGQAE